MITITELYDRLTEIDEQLKLEYEDGETSYASILEVEEERLEQIICLLVVHKVNSVTTIKVTNIVWDAPKSVNLPKQLIIKINMDNVDLLEDIENDADNLSDYLSDTYDYCHKGFVAKWN